MKNFGMCVSQKDEKKKKKLATVSEEENIVEHCRKTLY